MKKLILIILFCPTLLYSQWIQQTVPPNIDMVICVDFINANTGVAGGWENVQIFKGTALYTTNSGTNWITAQIPDSSRAIAKAQFINDNTGYSAGAYNSSNPYSLKSKSNYRLHLPTQIRKYYERIGMTGTKENYRGLFLKTTNKGQSWFTLDNLPTNVYYLMGMYFINQNTGFVTAAFDYYGGILDGILRTTNGGISWNTLTTVDSVSLNNIFSPDGNLIVATGWKRNYGLGFKGMILRSNNGGGNWTEIYFPEAYTFNDLHFINSSTGYIVGSDTSFFSIKAAIYQTTNSGMNWHNVHKVNHFCQYHGIEISSSGIGFAVGYSLGNSDNKRIPSYALISRTSNYGNNWTDNLLSDTSIILHSLSTANQNIWFVCGSRSSYFDAIIFKTTNGGVGIQPTSNEIPNKFSLYQNYPNPFNPSTKIRFDLQKPTHTKLIVFDVLGRKVATLVNEELKAGSYEVNFNGSNYSSGLYFYRLETREYSQTRKMLMMK